MEELRSGIDEIDLEIIKLMEKRWKIAKEIGRIKKEKGLDIYDPEREEDIVNALTEKTQLDKDFVKKIVNTMIEYCRNGEEG